MNHLTFKSILSVIMNNASSRALVAAVILVISGIISFVAEQGFVGLLLTIGGAIALSVAAYIKLVIGSGEPK